MRMSRDLMPIVIPFLANEVNRYLVHSHFVGRSTPLVTLKTNSDSFLWTSLNSLKSYSGGSHTFATAATRWGHSYVRRVLGIRSQFQHMNPTWILILGMQERIIHFLDAQAMHFGKSFKIRAIKSLFIYQDCLC